MIRFLIILVMSILLAVSSAADAGVRKHKMSGLVTSLGCGWNGRHGSSGIRYNCKDPTTAHKSIPFGTVIRVCNDSPKSSLYNVCTDVVVIDRGPQRACGAADMQPTAFRKITTNRGGEKVKLEIVNTKYSCTGYFCLSKKFGDIRITQEVLEQMKAGTYVPNNKAKQGKHTK